VHPADVPAAIMVLTNHRGHGGSRQRQVENLSDGLSVVSFAQQSTDKDKIKCCRCNKRGHIARDSMGAADNQESNVVDLMTMTALEVAVERWLGTFHKLRGVSSGRGQWMMIH